jgi:hypothetical protein
MRNRYKEKRPKRLGAMQVNPTRHTEPSYLRLLIQYGFLKHAEQRTYLPEAWGIWTGLCEDPLVRDIGIKIAKAKHTFLPSVAAPYANLARILAAATEKQITELRARHAVS